jgi:murein DD-endopeptidase MepM/ murein hydrolase activator NlpD
MYRGDILRRFLPIVFALFVGIILTMAPSSKVAMGRPPLQQSIYLPVVLSSEVTLGTVSETISPTLGGVIDLPSYAAVSIPGGAFDTPQLVQLAATISPQTEQEFLDTSSIFQTSAPLGYEINITLGDKAPKTAVTLSVTIPITLDSSIPHGAGLQSFAKLWQSDSEERLDNFEVIDSIQLSKTITMSLPSYAFTDQRRGDGLFEAIITLAATPVSSVQTSVAVVSSNCTGATLAPPLNGAIVATRPFNRGGTPHPITGSVTPHRGVDLKAADGTPVIAAASGTIETAGYQYNAAQRTGWGNYIVLRHDNGSATLYAHLQSDSLLPRGTHVMTGTQIARSDSSGGVTGPHLHFEYVPSGVINNRPDKVDPMPCMPSPPSCADSSFLAEPGDTLQLGVPIKATIDPVGDQDTFTFQADAQQYGVKLIDKSNPDEPLTPLMTITTPRGDVYETFEIAWGDPRLVGTWTFTVHATPTSRSPRGCYEISVVQI